MTTSTTTKPEAAGGRSLTRARPVTDVELARLRELHGAGLSCRQIAKEMGRAPVTISRRAAELGLSFDRSQVKEATAARVADAASLRAIVSMEFLTITQQINARVRKVLADGDPDECKPWHLRDYAYAAGAYFDRHLSQDQHDAKPENDADNAVDAWLEMMTGNAPPPSRSEDDNTNKIKSVLGGMMEALFDKYDVPEDERH